MADEWGQDPSVQAMRRVFSRMESAQEEFLKAAGISPFSARLRSWRDRARVCFERSWARAAGEGLKPSEEAAGSFYICCLSSVMLSEGVNIPETALPNDERVERVVKEILT